MFWCWGKCVRTGHGRSVCLRQGAVRCSPHPYPVRSGTPLGVSAIGFYTAKCGGGLSRWPLVHPPYGMVRRCQGAARGWYLNSPHRECLYHVFGSVCGHTERVCSLFVHLHLNREWNPCPCRSSRYLGASFPFSPPPPLMRSPSPARAGEAEMAGYSLPPSLRGKWRAQRAERGTLVFSTSLPVPR